VERMRERITIEEAHQVTNKKLLDELWWDPKVGDPFVIRGTNEIRIMIGDSYDSKFEGEDDANLDGEPYSLFYKDGEVAGRALCDDCLPLLSIFDMIDFLRTEEGTLQIQQVGTSYDWMVISKNVYIAAEGDDLVSLLWKAMLDSITK
jgi:hypothetical protein